MGHAVTAAQGSGLPSCSPRWSQPSPADPTDTENMDGVWASAAGCMRTYLILAEKAERFRHDPAIQEALAVAKAGRLAEPTRPAGGLEELRGATYDEPALASYGYGHERLDQLVARIGPGRHQLKHPCGSIQAALL